MAVNGKQKGNTWERGLANILSERFECATGLKNAFRRNADSGAFFGSGNAFRMKTHGTANAHFGDIICPRNFRWVIEAKHYKTAPSIKSLMNGDNKQIDAWLSECDYDAANAGKIGALVARWNHVPPMVFIPDALNVDPWMVYRDRTIVPLERWLECPDEHFFAATE